MKRQIAIQSVSKINNFTQVIFNNPNDDNANNKSCDKVKSILKYFPQFVADQEILEFPWSDAGDIYQ